MNKFNSGVKEAECWEINVLNKEQMFLLLLESKSAMNVE